MGRIHVLFLVLVALCALNAQGDVIVNPVVGTGNFSLVPNGSFENGLQGWAVEATYHPGHYEASQGVSIDGSWAAKSIPEPGTSSPPGWGFTRGQIVPFVGGQQYVISAYIDASRLRSGERASVDAFFEFVPGSTAAAIPGQPGLQFVYSTFTAPSTTSHWVRLNRDGSDSVVQPGVAAYYDDVAITPASQFVAPKSSANATGYHPQSEVGTAPDGSVKRLAQWNGSQWVPVQPHEITGGNVHVLVHGWAPGEKNWVLGQQQTESTTAAWDAVTPDGKSWFGDFTDLAKSVETRDPGSKVLAFTWLDHSATVGLPQGLSHAKESRDWTDASGQQLDYGLEQALSQNFAGGLQLYGHSHGARVAALAAELMGEHGKGSLVKQLTIADSPETLLPDMGGAANGLDTVLKKLTLGRASNKTFVDNYKSSILGGLYRVGSDNNLKNIVDVSLEPNVDPVTQVGTAHGYPNQWYKKANNANLFDVGLGWSPLVSTYYQALEPHYHQSWGDAGYNPDHELVLDSDTGISVGNNATIGPATVSSISSSGNVVTTGSAVQLTEGSPAFWYGSLHTDSWNSTLSFDYHFLNAGDGDQLGIWIDDELRFLSTGELAGTSVQSSLIDITDLAPGDHLLTYALHNYGDVQASVAVDNLAVGSVPEPGAIGFVTAAGICFLQRRQKTQLRCSECGSGN